MKAEIITIGDEILIGQTVDSNSALIGSELSKLGYSIVRITSVRDVKSDIHEAMVEAGNRSDIIIITGGLGPTSDDITKPALAEFFGCGLILNEDVLDNIKRLLEHRGFEMNRNNRLQAMVPEKARILNNLKGTAPGMVFEKNGKRYYSLPGVPYEMEHLVRDYIVPELRDLNRSQVVIHRNIMTFGTFEAKLAEVLEPFEADMPDKLKLAYLPSSGVIKLRLTATGSNRKELEEILDNKVAELYRMIPEFIFGEDEVSLEETIGNILRERGMTLVTAESCTGGNIARLITAVPGSSDYFKGSVVAYSNEVKVGILGVEKELIGRVGAVSREVVIAMAEGVREKLNGTWAVAVSGVAGPSGGTENKPVGTAWIAVSGPHGSVAEQIAFIAGRSVNIRRFSLAALNLLRQQIISH